MSWEISLNRDSDLIELVLAGDISAVEFTKATRQLNDLAAANNVMSMCYDFRNVQSGVEVHDILIHVRSLTASYGAAYGRIKKAILKSGQPTVDKNLQFWEDCCFNKGVRARLFMDRPSALCWLSEGK